MLNNASDYKFLKTADIGSFINGDIMPLKFPNKNTIAPLRFEDYLFLTEGFYERMNVELVGDNTVLPPVRTIYASKILATQFTSSSGVIYGSTIGYNNQAGTYINPNANVKTGNLTFPHNSGTSYESILGSYITDYAIDTVADKMNSSLRPLTYARRPLFAEYIRARYYDLNRLKLFEVKLAIGDLATSSTIYYYNRDGEITSTTNQNLATTVFGNLITTNVSLGIAYKSSEQVFQLKDNIITLPYAKTAKLIYSAVASKSTSGNTTEYQTISSIDLSISNGNVQCPNDLINNIISNTLNAAGYELYDTTGIVSVRLDECILLVEFDFPASFNVNWNWQP